MSYQVLVINDPGTLIRFPEKIFPLEFAEFVPPTLISHDAAEIRDFTERHREVVIKPLCQYGGRGIARLTATAFDEELVSARLKETGLLLVAQVFLPRVTEGDKRILTGTGLPRGDQADGMTIGVHVDHQGSRIGGGGNRISSWLEVPRPRGLRKRRARRR
jgi:glutathione synthase/RimK-type ligase-like ATP-grasp enzyme